MGQLVGKLLEQGQVVFLYFMFQEKNEKFFKKMNFLKQIRFKPEYEGSRFI